MTTKSITEYGCDICEESTMGESYELPYGWAEVEVRGRNTHVCKKCLEKLTEQGLKSAQTRS